MNSTRYVSFLTLKLQSFSAHLSKIPLRQSRGKQNKKSNRQLIALSLCEVAHISESEILINKNAELCSTLSFAVVAFNYTMHTLGRRSTFVIDFVGTERENRILHTKTEGNW